MIKMSAIFGLLNTDRLQVRCNRSAISIFVLIIVLGSLPGARQDVGQLASGLVLHSVAYAVLGSLLFLGGSGNGSRRAIKATLAIAVMGALDEGVQSFFPYRTAAVSDWMVDVAAAGVASLLLWKLWPVVTNQQARDQT
jgi:VanZ family protein